MESFGCPVGIYSLISQNLCNLLQLIPPHTHPYIFKSGHPKQKKGKLEGEPCL